MHRLVKEHLEKIILFLEALESILKDSIRENIIDEILL